MPIDKFEYLGDGVYGKHDGFGILLHINNHLNPTDVVYLEPDVLNNIINFNNRIKAEIKELDN